MKATMFCLSILLLVGCGGRSKDDSKQTKSSAKPNATLKEKPTINVYIENSCSMDGYVKGVTEFEQTIYNYLSDIKISGITDNLNLLYINSDAIPYASTVDADVIADFIKKLEPNTFKQRGGNRGFSDIANVIKTILAETESNKIAILVTDGIFSPGKGKDATEYFAIQQIGIKNTMAEHLKKHPNTAVIVYQLYSNFNGIYYNNIDTKIRINEQRPYYIWIMGDAQQLAKLRSEVPESKFNGNGVANMFSIVAGNQKIDYAVKANSGDFSKSRNNPKTEIEDLSKDRRTGKVRFAVNANFTNLLLDDNYLANSGNYKVENYKLAVKKNDNQSKYTHSLNFTADKVRNGELSVKLKTTIPAWVEAANDDDGTKAAAGKTYGIKYQINGIYKAFTNKTDYYTEIKIRIK